MTANDMAETVESAARHYEKHCDDGMAADLRAVAAQLRQAAAEGQGNETLADLERRLRHWTVLNACERLDGKIPTGLNPLTVLGWMGIDCPELLPRIQATPTEPPCDEGCSRCSGEYCDTHHTAPCECDTADRHVIAATPTEPTPPPAVRHVCGLQGYNPMIDDPCPACVERERSAVGRCKTCRHFQAFALPRTDALCRAVGNGSLFKAVPADGSGFCHLHEAA